MEFVKIKGVNCNLEEVVSSYDATHFGYVGKIKDFRNAGLLPDNDGELWLFVSNDIRLTNRLGFTKTDAIVDVLDLDGEL